MCSSSSSSSSGSGGALLQKRKVPKREKKPQSLYIYIYCRSVYLSSAVFDTGAEGVPDFPERAATCFFTAANPLLF